MRPIPVYVDRFLNYSYNSHLSLYFLVMSENLDKNVALLVMSRFCQVTERSEVTCEILVSDI